MAALNLGMVTAYAYAVQGGYTGTEADFTALLGNIAEDLAEIENLTVTATTLPAGSSATASYSDGVLTLGIPKGDKGDKGDTGATGPTGATPNLSIGTVTTGVAGSDASATITGTAENPVLNMTIPRGNSGDEGLLATAYSSSATYSVGDYCIYNDILYRCTTAISTAEAWTAAHWTAVTVGDELTGLKADFINVSKLNLGKLFFVENSNRRLIISNGSVIDTTGYITTDDIDVFAGGFITCDRETLINISFYEQDGTFIVSKTAYEFFEIPTNAYYAKIGGYAANLSDLRHLNFTMHSASADKLDELTTLKNVRYASGLLRNDVTGQCSSWYIDVESYDSIAIMNTNTSSSTANFFDGSRTYISAVSIYGKNNAPYNVIDVPTNAKYMIISSVTGNDISVYINNIAVSDEVIEIGTGKKYTSILNALKSNPKAKRFVVSAGTFNIVDEYEDEYSASFWSDYTGYTGSMDYFLRGLNLYPGQEITFMPGAVVEFDYSGTNANVASYFSVFNLTYNNTIDGAYISFGNGIARYAIHDDAAIKFGTNQIKNCIFDGTSGNGPVIGGGCGLNNRYIIDHCMFVNNSGYTDIMYHNNLNAGAVNRVHVRDCKGDKGCSFLYCGASTVVSDFIVSNSKFPAITVLPHPSASHENVNIQLTKFCNDETAV